MSKELINDDLIATLLSILLEKTSFQKDSIYYETQDDSQLILFLLKMNDVNQQENKQTLKELVAIFDRLVPRRDNECSWMISFVLNGEVVDTYFGGNNSSPKIGFPASWC